MVPLGYPADSRAVPLRFGRRRNFSTRNKAEQLSVRDEVVPSRRGSVFARGGATRAGTSAARLSDAVRWFRGKARPIESARVVPTVVRMRCHGDLHPGEVLYTGRDFVIIDFEGKQARPPAERRRKRADWST